MMQLFKPGSVNTALAIESKWPAATLWATLRNRSSTSKVTGEVIDVELIAIYTHEPCIIIYRT